MGYQLDFAPDLKRWLAALEADQPDIARQVNEALDTLRAKGEQVGPPLVVPVSYQQRHREVAPELERTYMRQLDALAQLRREASEVAALRKSLEDRLDDATADDQRERLRSAYEGIRVQEERITEVCQRMDLDMHAYRARKEAIMASLTEAIIDGLAMLADVADVMGPTDLEQPGGRLMELRPGAPKSIVARVLFTVDEPGRSAQFVAAATERDVLAAWYDRVVPHHYAAGNAPQVATQKESPAAS
jgi:hypothetical protein